MNNISFSDLVGKTILIGLTYYTADNEFIEQKQYWGTVIESNENQILVKLNDGEIFGFLGPNGAGKTTTIKLLTGILKADEGKISVNGIDISEKMLEIAKEENSDSKITYINMPMENISQLNEKFDIVVSSLAFHYVEDFSGVVKNIFDMQPFSLSSVVSTGYVRYALEVPKGWFEKVGIKTGDKIILDF